MPRRKVGFFVFQDLDLSLAPCNSDRSVFRWENRMNTIDTVGWLRTFQDSRAFLFLSVLGFMALSPGCLPKPPSDPDPLLQPRGEQSKSCGQNPCPQAVAVQFSLPLKPEFELPENSQNLEPQPASDPTDVKGAESQATLFFAPGVADRVEGTLVLTNQSLKSSLQNVKIRSEVGEFALPEVLPGGRQVVRFGMEEPKSLTWSMSFARATPTRSGVSKSAVLIGNRIWAGDAGTGTVFVYQAQPLSLLAEIKVAGLSQGIAETDGDVIVGSGSQLLIFDEKSRKIRQKIPGGAGANFERAQVVALGDSAFVNSGKELLRYERRDTGWAAAGKRDLEQPPTSLLLRNERLVVSYGSNLLAEAAPEMSPEISPEMEAKDEAPKAGVLNSDAPIAEAPPIAEVLEASLGKTWGTLVLQSPTDPSVAACWKAEKEASVPEGSWEPGQLVQDSRVKGGHGLVFGAGSFWWPAWLEQTQHRKSEPILLSKGLWNSTFQQPCLQSVWKESATVDAPLWDDTWGPGALNGKVGLQFLNAPEGVSSVWRPANAMSNVGILRDIEFSANENSVFLLSSEKSRLSEWDALTGVPKSRESKDLPLVDPETLLISPGTDRSLWILSANKLQVLRLFPSDPSGAWRPFVPFNWNLLVPSPVSPGNTFQEFLSFVSGKVVQGQVDVLPVSTQWQIAESFGVP